MNLISVYERPDRHDVLYRLLAEQFVQTDQLDPEQIPVLFESRGEERLARLIRLSGILPREANRRVSEHQLRQGPIVPAKVPQMIECECGVEEADLTHVALSTIQLPEEILATALDTIGTEAAEQRLPGRRVDGRRTGC